ncbi:HbrB-like-domain-containing protein [Microdochium trichocladiopsis]|uniref:HbrB-like-domain-containing protein n=1 Tax=Microdochium trichocladiopsis TaxID=1682393 RepID=A0A9P8XWW3_9PEZI|nr:HbrB-like-domain-containing protein [Microdochium trichocladiopsis]KAH7021427.1 HbrB-like-domain-containing protein [Microdochium trichocladiopsis]
MAQPPSRAQRAPGSFSPMPGSFSSSAAAAAAASSASSLSSSSAVATGNGTGPPASRPGIRRIDTSSSEDSSSIYQPKTRTPQTPINVTSPGGFPFGQHHNSSSSSLHNFSRPVRPSDSPAAARNASPLAPPGTRGHSRKHSHSQGHFEPFLPSTSMSNLSQISMPPPASTTALSASQIAAQAAMQIQQPQNLQHQQVPILQHPVSRAEQQHQAQQQQSRSRSQTVPFPGNEASEPPRRQPPPKLTPPVLSLTEASVPRDHAFGADQVYRNGLLGSQSANATAAASTVFPKSPVTSPSFPDQPPPLPDKPAKLEKSKVKLFSRPKKIETKSDTREKPLPSPGKIGSALASLQRGNYSTTSLADPSPSFYNLANSSSATIRAVESTDKEKEKKPHFLSRQKHKLTSKDDYHLPLSSAASNSRPVDPNAPAPLYNFNLPPSPGLNSNFSKSVSGLDLRHGGRALREKRKEDKLETRQDNESSFNVGGSNDWAGPSSLGTITPSFFDSVDGTKYGLNNMSIDDAWPYLRAKLLSIFEGEDLRITIEDLNRVVTMHIQYCIVRRSAYIIIDDLRDLLSTGFSSLDHTLRKTPEDRLIPALVELWLFTFTSILPYLQAVFLPLDLEFQGCGPLLNGDQARDFWGGVLAASPAPGSQPSYEPASSVLDVRRLVLTAYRDKVILPRYDKLKTIFSRLSLEHLPSSFGSLGLQQPPPLHDGMGSLSSSPSDYYGARPGTAMSLDPSNGSYNSSSTTLFGEGSNPSRSRAISNVSYASGGSDPMSVGGSGGASHRPFTPQAGAGITLGSLREQNVEDSKQITEMVGRMLQCMSVLASVGNSPGSNTLADPSLLSTLSGADEGSKMMSELGRLLKLNWLGRGRTGRNRRGMVGGRVKRSFLALIVDCSGYSLSRRAKTVEVDLAVQAGQVVTSVVFFPWVATNARRDRKHTDQGLKLLLLECALHRNFIGI